MAIIQEQVSPIKAVIDLGTNTFHLLIAQLQDNGEIKELYRERVFVKLAAEGIETIGAAPFKRALGAMIHFKKIMDEYNCESISAMGTAALRTASNGADFVAQVAATTKIEVELISGEEEALLITQGVLAALPPQQERILIMDIGGGSTEYIIVEGKDIIFQQSFPIGISVLYNRFHRADPITEDEQRQLMHHLAKVTAPLTAALQLYPTYHLTGAAGTFDVLADMLLDPDAEKHRTSRQLSLGEFPALAAEIIGATYAQLARIPGLPSERVDMITVAILLLEFTINLADIKRITVSDWAMKEGILLRG